MPGLSVVDGDARAATAALSDVLAETAAYDHYETGIAHESDRCLVGATRYEGYPLRRMETEHGTAFLEGELYDVADVQGQVQHVASLLAADDTAGVREWVGDRDGDFLLVVTDGAETAIVNDAFGRLPVYHATVGGDVVCSRELAVVRALAGRRDDPVDLDRLAIAQLLCLGYPLGTRTPFAEVSTVPPGSLVRLRDGAVAIESTYEHDFAETPHETRSLDANADELADRIAAACRRRHSPERDTVVSLSGGLDSRTVAAAYAREAVAGGPASGSSARGSATGDRGSAAADPSVRTATFQRGNGRLEAEVTTARDVAKRLGLPWDAYTVEATGDHRRRLLASKQGLNYLGVAHVLDFLEQLRERHGTATYVTGDGGDKVLVGLEPVARLRSETALVDHALDVNSRLSPATAAAIANVDEAAIRASVAERLRSYPEDGRRRRYVHFLVRERGINFLLHGEDRNRYLAWSASPFYALPVFEYAMACPDGQKAYRRLQAAVLERFDPGLVDLHYPNFGAPISSRRYRLKQFLYDQLERSPAVRDRLIDLVTGDAAPRSTLVEAIRTELDGLDDAGLSAGAARDVLDAPEAYSGVEFELLATVAALANDLVAGGDGAPAARDGITTAPSAASPPAETATGSGDGSEATPDTPDRDRRDEQ